MLLGDAAHTTHFSQGFGTMFAFDDAAALHAALMEENVIPKALERYDASQKPKVATFQATSVASMQWAESLLPGILVTVGFFLPCLFVGYYSLRSRELESK